jgi:hypothetical protein
MIMNRKNVPIKTSQGADEIITRTRGLAPRVRTALLLVDGVKSVAELERLMVAIGVTPDALQLLLDKGLIRFSDDQLRTENAPAVKPTTPGVPLAAKEPPSFVKSRIADSANEPLVSAKKVTAEKRGGERQGAQPLKGGGESAPKALHPPLAPGSASARAAADADTSSPAALPHVLEVVTLLEVETILGGASKLEMETIVNVAEKLELTPTLMLAPNTAVKVPLTEPMRLPPLAQAQSDYQTASARGKVVPASVLHMNLTVARAHLANALDQYLEIDGYAIKQRVVACTARADLEQMFRLIEGALSQKADKLAVTRVMGIARSLLDR